MNAFELYFAAMLRDIPRVRADVDRYGEAAVRSAVRDIWLKEHGMTDRSARLAAVGRVQRARFSGDWSGVNDVDCAVFEQSRQDPLFFIEPGAVQPTRRIGA